MFGDGDMIGRTLKIIAVLLVFGVAPVDVIAADQITDLDASVSRGGRIYNDWMIELDDRAPRKTNPNFTKKADNK